MYERFIKRNGAEIGPYYYHSVKTKEGKVKSIYLGSDMEKAKQKLELLELDVIKQIATAPLREKSVEQIFNELDQVNDMLNEPS